MLEELEIRNLGPIRHADIEFSQGLIAITGETGAGKSMLLSALGLVSGGPVDSSRVSPGESQAWAQAVFSVDGGNSGDNGDAGDAAVRIAADAGVEVDDGELFLTRSVPCEGRSKAVLNGNSVPRSVLGAVAAELITVHGQADQLRIASHAKQREFLDSYAHDETQLGEYQETFHAMDELGKRINRLRNQQSDARARAEFLHDAIARIDEVKPKSHEDEELVAQRTRIENSAQIIQAVSGAVGALDASALGSEMDSDGSGSGSVVSLIRQAVDALNPVSTFPEYQDSINRLHAAGEELQDIVFELSSHLDFDESSETDLDALNERIYQLGELTKRWGPTLDDVIAWREKAEFELEDVEASPEQIHELETQYAQLVAQASQRAEALHDARVKAAARLSKDVDSELGALAMAGSSLSIRVEARKSADSGVSRGVDINDGMDINGGDDIEFLFTPFPGSAPLPLGKSASGGELSRLMLALELSAAAGRSAGQRAGSNQTFVFDEIDAGVGGAAALELGRRLARLAQSTQVVVVTHLPQVASWADSQFVVSRSAPTGTAATGGSQTSVSRVDGAARTDEIARMLSGSISPTSRQHAQELLETSRLGHEITHGSPTRKESHDFE
jgi:DNA repair protein RecN (Recombination protein N)